MLVTYHKNALRQPNQLIPSKAFFGYRKRVSQIANNSEPEKCYNLLPLALALRFFVCALRCREAADMRILQCRGYNTLKRDSRVQFQSSWLLMSYWRRYLFNTLLARFTRSITSRRNYTLSTHNLLTRSSRTAELAHLTPMHSRRAFADRNSIIRQRNRFTVLTKVTSLRITLNRPSSFYSSGTCYTNTFKHVESNAE